MAYELSGLLAEFKARGLDLVEEGAKQAVDATLAWFESEAKKSATPIDDVFLVLVPTLRKAVLEAVDKIDGKVG